MQYDYDVVIVGAGMVGASFVCALAPSGLKIAVIEATALDHDQQPDYDDRGLALAPSSQRILEQLKIWPWIQADQTPIKKIHVSEQGGFGFTCLDANEMAKTELGHVVSAHTLVKTLQKQILQFENIKLICPGRLSYFYKIDSMMRLVITYSGNTEIVTTRLLVGADGSRSPVRNLAGINTKERDFKQTAIVCNVTTQRPNAATAYERFTRHGPIALLPIAKNRSVLVFTVHKDKAKSYQLISDEQYIDIIQTGLGRRLGKIERIGRRHSYPIISIEAIEQYRAQLVLLGNAAHTIHPNAAQGFNLALRDVAGLVECLLAAITNGGTLDDIRILENYIALRRADQQRVIRLTNHLAWCFYNQSVLLGLTRNVAMILLDSLPSLKTSFAKTAMGLSGLQPQLVSGQHIYDNVIK